MNITFLTLFISDAVVNFNIYTSYSLFIEQKSQKFCGYEQEIVCLYIGVCLVSNKYGSNNRKVKKSMVIKRNSSFIYLSCCSFK